MKARKKFNKLRAITSKVIKSLPPNALAWGHRGEELEKDAENSCQKKI